MVKHRSLCIVVADGGQARFVRPAADHALHTLETVEATSLHQQSSDLKSDRPGRSFESANPARHALAPRTDPHAMEKERFAQFLGGKICAESGQGAFDALVLVAPAHVLAELRGTLDEETAKKLVGTLAKDLVKVPDEALQPHLQEWVRPVHRQ
ncbi:MAG: host attachment protein [Acetobacteraceae bacterium]|nr:host attachment protein [Acetobacteraceae bacterium]